ncbi:MAG: hypothetical protein BWY03_00294 [Parcubacteria group bacterium ADurb.Bin159]|jgi:uncharacterized membrane protein YkgB|nr:MAG: hypothetical protein BWY03_00294 [Parcubacteria group bacterium ADurb.Bin159]
MTKEQKEKNQKQDRLSSGIKKIAYFMGAVIVFLGLIVLLNIKTDFINSWSASLMKLLIG